MTRRQIYLVRFYEHEKPYRVSAAHRYQADIIASKLAAKYGWTVASVGVLVR